MFRSQAFRSVARSARQTYIPAARPISQQKRSFIPTPWLRQSDKEHDAATTSGKPGESGDHEGQFARTEEGMRVEYPEDHKLPRSEPVSGRGGEHNKRTLASFSLDGKVAVITGGARGLGLVMTQALVISGADVAIVDLNSEYCIAHTTIACADCEQRRKLRGKQRPSSMTSSAKIRVQTAYPGSPPIMPTFQIKSLSRAPSPTFSKSTARSTL